MEKNDNFNRIEYAELVNSLKELTVALNKHTQICERNSVKMEHLTLALRGLASALRNETGLETSGPSLQLKQGIAEFVKYYINPQFYKTTELRLVDRRELD